MTSGEVFGLLGTYEDVTERVEAQQQLERHNAVLLAQQETSPDAILVVDDTARIVSCNRRFIDLWKIPEKLVEAGVDEPVLRTVMAQMSDPEAFLARVRYLEEHKSEKSHEELQLKDGRVIDRYSSPAIGLEGKYFGRVWYFRDITERKQTEEQILTLNKDLESKVEARTRQLLDAQDELVRKEKLALLGQVAGSVGHELRNPLGVMNNAVYFLQTVLTDADATTREYLEIIKVEIAEADRIVADLLDSVRTKPPHPAAVGVREVIDQTLRQNPVPAAMTVTLEIPAALPPVWVDAMQIQQVFRNLISNGVEAMTEGGTLTIGAVENSRDGTGERQRTRQRQRHAPGSAGQAVSTAVHHQGARYRAGSGGGEEPDPIQRRHDHGGECGRPGHHIYRGAARQFCRRGELNAFLNQNRTECDSGGVAHRAIAWGRGISANTLRVAGPHRPRGSRDCLGVDGGYRSGPA